MADTPSYVRETLLTGKPREASIEVAAIAVLSTLGISLLAWRNGSALLFVLAATRENVFAGHEYWRLITAVAIHADMLHFLSNALFLGVFACLLFGYFGFWVFPVLSIAMAALTNFISLLTYPAGASLVGASGMVYWMAGFWLTMYLFVERRLGVGTRFLRTIGFALIVLLPSGFQENVSYRTHAIGFGLGVVSALVYFQHNRASIRAAEVEEVEMDEELDYSEELPPN